MLVSCLDTLQNLKSVLLSSNNISDRTFVKLATLISKSQLACATLHLGETKPTCVGLIALFQSLEENKTIKNLFLNDILIGNDAAKALNKTLVRNTELRQLNLGNCGIDNETIGFIKFGFMCNQTLKSIYLWKNSITNEGLFLIKNMLEEHNFTLLELLISDNLIDDQYLLDESKMLLKRNQKLENIKTNLSDIFQVWETIQNYHQNQEDSKTTEYIQRGDQVSILEKQIKEAEIKLEEAKRVLQTLKK